MIEGINAMNAPVESMTINNLKDLALIAVGTVSVAISVMMYFNAKKSLLLPLRTEVIKKQVELLTALLNLTSSNKMKFLRSCDFSSIFELNVAYYLQEIGCKVELSIPTDIGEATAGALLTVEDDENIHAFSLSENRQESASEYSEQRWLEAKKGNFRIQLVHFTNTHLKFKNELTEIMNSPYIPSEIRSDLTHLTNSIETNLRGPMKQSIENAVQKITSSSGTKEPFDFIKAYNEFIECSEDMTPFCDNLVTKIRKLLKVDEPW